MPKNVLKKKSRENRFWIFGRFCSLKLLNLIFVFLASSAT
jgi:hypothetical protein